MLNRVGTPGWNTGLEPVTPAPWPPHHAMYICWLHHTMPCALIDFFYQFIILRQIRFHVSFWYRFWFEQYLIVLLTSHKNDVRYNFPYRPRLETGEWRLTADLCRNTQCWLVPRTPFNWLKRRLVIYRWNGNFMLNPTVCYLEFKNDLKRREERLNAANAELMCWRFTPGCKNILINVIIFFLSFFHSVSFRPILIWRSNFFGIGE